MNIKPIPLLSDNYAWLLWREGSSECAVVDPSEPDGVRQVVEAQGLTLRTILATHHHWDHTGGIDGLFESGMDVVASTYDREQGRVPHVTRSFGDGDTFELLGEPVRCMMVPGHTLGAVAFYLPESEAVFTGDTLFTAGCGRLFEGTPAQMHASLSRLAQLPTSTQVYCGHEYTEKNMRFALSLQPTHGGLKQRCEQVAAARSKGEPTVPAPLSVELATNPFLRARAPELAAVVGGGDPVEVFAELRRRRDGF